MPIGRVARGDRTWIWCVCGALHLLAKPRADKHGQDRRKYHFPNFHNLIFFHFFWPFLIYPCRAACSRNTFGGTPHPRDEAGTIASHFWPFAHFLREAFYQKCARCVKKTNAESFRRNYGSKHRLLVGLPHAGGGQWNALWLGTYFVVASKSAQSIAKVVLWVS